mgnify:CR=1 FL=1
MTIQFINVSFSYPQSGESVFEHISFQLDTEWKTGLIGRNGRGKTTLLKLLKGEFEGEYQGTVSRPAGIEYFPCAVRDGKEYVLSVAEEISGAEEWRVLRELSLLEFPDEALYRPFDTLSGGERTKALLAAMFLREGRFLLLDDIAQCNQASGCVSYRIHPVSSAGRSHPFRDLSAYLPPVTWLPLG